MRESNDDVKQRNSKLVREMATSKKKKKNQIIKEPT